MKVTKIKLASLALVGLVGVGGLGAAYAANETASNNGYPPIVKKLATKFNLSEDEVKKVFDEQRSEHQAEHKQKLEERLSQAVKDGKLTEDQKTKLLAKLEEIHASRQEAREEAKEAREQKHAEFKAWAEQNGINLEEVLPFVGKHKHRHDMRP